MNSTKTIRRYLDGSAEDGSGCGIVIIAVDRQSGSLFCKIVLLLKNCIAMQAEMLINCSGR